MTRPCTCHRARDLLDRTVAPGRPIAGIAQLLEPLTHHRRGFGVGLFDEAPHRVVAERRIVVKIEVMAFDGARQMREQRHLIECRGDFGGAAEAVPHLAFEPARIGGAAADHAGDLFGERPHPWRIRHCRVGVIQRLARRRPAFAPRRQIRPRGRHNPAPPEDRFRADPGCGQKRRWRRCVVPAPAAPPRRPGRRHRQKRWRQARLRRHPRRYPA